MNPAALAEAALVGAFFGVLALPGLRKAGARTAVLLVFLIALLGTAMTQLPLMVKSLQLAGYPL